MNDTDFYQSYLKSCQEWDARNETRFFIMAVFDYADGVRVANLLRQNGYIVEITNKNKFDYCQLTIERKSSTPH